MIIVVIYFAFFIGISLFQYRKKTCTLDSFTVANRSKSTFPVMISLVASCIGGSATIGVVSLAWNKGFPAIWYLASGAIGLLILTIFLSKKVRKTGLRTLPEIIEYYVNPRARFIAAIIISIAWIAILAAQFRASAEIISSLSSLSYPAALGVGALCIIAYTTIGGQASVIKSDVLQFVLIFVALVFVLIFLRGKYPSSGSSIEYNLFNSEFTFSTWSYYMLIIGGSYVVCPMLFSRLLSAKNERTAYKAALIAVPVLLLTAFIIVYIGLMLRNIVPASTVSTEVLTNAIASYLPKWLSVFLSIALLSAIVSSADSCLITSATVIGNDVIKTPSVFICRIITIIVGIVSFLLALSGNGILSLLFAANDIFVAGIVSPVFVSMVIKKKYKLDNRWIIIAMIVGGSFGLSAALSSIKILSMLGVLFSIILSLFAIRKKENCRITTCTQE